MKIPSFQAHTLGIQQGWSEEQNSQQLPYESGGGKPLQECTGSGVRS